MPIFAMHLTGKRTCLRGSDTGPLWIFVIIFTVNIELHRFYTGNFHELGLKVGVFAIRSYKNTFIIWRRCYSGDNVVS